MPARRAAPRRAASRRRAAPLWLVAALIAAAAVPLPVSMRATAGVTPADALRAKASVRPDAAARVAASGALLEIEAGSVAGVTEVEVAPLAEPELAALDPGMTNVTAGAGRGYRFGPHGTRFLKPTRLTLPYDEHLLPRGATATDVRTFYYDETLGRWVALPRLRVEPAAGTVVSVTDHFTDFIAATLVVPTHPDVAAFAPTMMQDMKAADPGQGIDLIQPPEANPIGEGRLSLPVEVPPGRNGLQPTLALLYQSQGGNGWLGVGWSIQIPEIVVDVRWGVPRYGVLPDASGTVAYRNKETESYLMNGVELAPVANRGAFEDRVGSEKTFQARVEGEFDRVVRHGDHPANFWWEVTDRNGVRYLYGEPPGVTGPGALRDDAGNIFRWTLREVRDVHDNAMRFEYDLVSDAGVEGGAVSGRQIYLREINYTGRSDGGGYSRGPYTVRFLRDSDPALAPRLKRRDVQIDCRGGFMEVTAERLRRIRVELDGETVREYELVYEEGAFGKTLLAAIEPRGVGGTPFPGSEHRFAYYDDVRNPSGAYASGFAAEESWDVPSDGVDLCADLGPVDVCPDLIAPGYDQATMLGGSITHGFGGHSYIGLNCGLPTKENSAGIKIGFTHSQTDTRLALLDVNGDNLPDKVFRSGSGFAYRENEAHPGGRRSFSLATHSISNLDAIGAETATTGLGGPEAYFFGTTAIGSVSGTLTLGTTYSTDANGDGFVDIVQDGQILYSHLGPGGRPVFESTSANTPLPLARGSIDGGGLIGDYEPQFQDLVDQYPLLDVFRRWLAPYDGTIRIQGAVQLESPSESADGVRVSIQQDETELWSARIPAGDGSVYPLSGVDRVRVSRGDRLYFRVQSAFEGSGDVVDWDPEIEYLDVVPATDANELDAYRYRASEDFVLAGRAGEARMPYTGDVHVTGVLEKPDTTSDDVSVSVLRDSVELFRATMPWDSTGEVPLDLRFSVTADDTSTHDVDEADRVHVQLVVDSPIDTRGVGWRSDAAPELIYERAVGAPVTDRNGDPLIRILLPSDLDLYPAVNLDAPQQTWEAPQGGTISVTTGLGGDWSFRVTGVEQPVLDGEIAFTVKRSGAPLGRGKVQIRDGRAQNITLGGIGIGSGDRLFFDFSMRNASARGTVGVRVKYDGASSDQAVPCALHANVDYDDVAILGRGLFPQPYRGWGYAGYNGNPDRDSPERPHACSGSQPTPTQVIREADLVLEPSLALVAARRVRAEIVDSVRSQKAYPFSPVFERLADGRVRASWRGPDDAGWIQANRASSTRNGVHLVGVPCASDLGGGADSRAIPRIGNNASVGGSVGFIIGVSGSIGRNWSGADFIDLNGDQFPDLVGNGRAQFTLPDGGLEARNRSLSVLDPVRSSDDLAGSITIGGTVPLSRGGSRGKQASNSKTAPKGERVENSMPSLGFSGGLGTGSSKVKEDLADINGDGLPDRVFSDGTVQLNLGYTFAAAESWPGLGLDESSSIEGSLGVDLGFNDFIYGWAGGLSYSRAVSHTHRSLVDLNGDGLVDRVREDGGNLWVAFNDGNAFGTETLWQGASIGDIVTSANASLGAGLYVTIPVPIFLCTPVTALFLIINPGGFASTAMARQEASLLDVDGDRCADYVHSSRDDEMVVARNRTGRTNLLRRVDRPLGGSFTLDYEQRGNTPDLPQPQWVLSRVEVSDGVAGDGPSPLLTTFAYRSPRYDRGEREFYGFGEVVEEHRSAEDPGRVARSVTRAYRNDSYYGKGLMTSETTRDADGRPFRTTEYRYQFRDVATQGPAPGLASRTATIFPMMVETISRTDEGVVGQNLASRRALEYEALGNVTRVLDSGDAGPDDDLETTIEYTPCPGSLVLSRPTAIVVRSGGATLAERHATVDCATGEVLQIRERVADGAEAVTDLSYYPTGLLRSVTGPANLHGQRYQLLYEYDPRTSTHATRIEDSFGLVSTATYDLRYGRTESATDPNGNGVTYAYDEFGRLAGITGPYEYGSGTVTLGFEYHPEAPVAWALTRHLDEPRGPADPIETILFADGLGRIIQTKVDGTIHTSPGTPAADVMIVSGRARYDALGRVAEQYQPTPEPLGAGPLFNPAFDPAPPSRIEYDVLDRPTTVTEPDNTTTRYLYALAPDRTGRLRAETTVIDANGRQRRLYRDSQDALVAVREGAGGDLWTSYEYDALGRLLSVEDANGNATRIQYDGLGRRAQIVRPDAGATRYEYDAASNLVALQTANLIARNQAIRYDYDFTRLTAAHYPEVREPDDDRAGRLKDDSGGENGDGRPGEDVTFEYGGPGAPDNGAGRLVRITDPSGIERRAYGKLGEVVRQDRTFAGGGDDDGPPPTYTTQYRYDTWGRLIGLVYPDGEALAYEYDAGGLVRRAVGSDRGRTYEYLRRLEYDRFRKQAYLEMGNGVRTTFEYRPDDQRLSRLRSVSAAGEFQDLRYTYDPVGNLTSLANDVPAPTRSEGGGPTVQRFEYDELYRLVGASGAYQFAPRKSSVYTLALRYDAIHNILEKRQTHDVVDASGHRARQRGTTYDAVYGYSAARPHAPARVGELDVTYDANGNQTGLTEDRHDDRRRIVWDDENRIRSVSIHGKKTRFAYDASGARVLKAGSDGAVAYVNQFFTVRNGEVFTHHVYVGGTRLASRIVEPPDSKGERDADEDVVYFYHPDQLGSTQFVTDARGAVTQHLEYFPFGEIWVNEMEGEEQTDLGFSGQELDPETGLYYFGARYQDPRLAQFLSVDPASARDGDELAASGPAALNAYAFAFDNPVRLVDATGLDPGWWSEQNQTFGQFQGAVGHSVAGARAPPATSKVFGATDSPVRAATATGAGDFVAGAGVGVIATAPPPTSQVATARERANAVIAPPRGIRGPPADAAAPAQTRTPSNVGEGAAASLDTRPPVVLGENMDGRVSPYAKSIGAETIVHWLAGRPWTRPLNVEFIAHIRAEGRKAIDIGPDFPRRLRERGKPQQFRPVYPEERMQMRGYANYRQVYVRTGKYEGGVPGLDFPGAAGGGAAGAQP